MNVSEPITHLRPVSKQRLRLWLRLLKFNRRIEAELRERLRVNFNTTLPRFDVMAALHRNPKGLQMSELSSMLMVSNGNVTGIVRRLTDDGHILRETVPGDRRAAKVRLTREGLAAFELQAAAHQGWVDELLGGFGPRDITKISDLLAIVVGDDHEGGHHAV